MLKKIAIQRYIIAPNQLMHAAESNFKIDNAERIGSIKKSDLQVDRYHRLIQESELKTKKMDQSIDRLHRPIQSEDRMHGGELCRSMDTDQRAWTCDCCHPAVYNIFLTVFMCFTITPPWYSI